VTCTFKTSEPAAAVTCEAELVRALQEAARKACAAYGVPKIYFARSLGRRLHYLTGFGEETYLPAARESLGHDIWVFIEGGDRLAAGQKGRLLAELRQAVAACAGAVKADPQGAAENQPRAGKRKETTE